VKQTVAVLNPAIYNLIKNQTSTLAPTVTQIGQSGYTFLGGHMGFFIGSRVKYKNPEKIYNKFRGEFGVITKIFRDNIQTYFFVQLENVQMQNEAKRINARPWYYWNGDQSWLRCTYDQIEPGLIFGSCGSKYKFLPCYGPFVVGNHVKVELMDQHYIIFNGTWGHIKQIVMRGNGHAQFFVELDSAELQKKVKEINKRPWYDKKLDQSWLRCRITQIFSLKSVLNRAVAAGGFSGSLIVSTQPLESGKKRKGLG